MRALAVKQCKAGACDVIPQGSLALDMDALAATLAAAGYEVVCNAGRALVVRKGVEATVFDNGRMKVKTPNEVDALSIGKEILALAEK